MPSLALRPDPLPGYVEYFLDCAVEAYDLDACTHSVLRLFGAADEVTPLIPGPVEPRAAGGSLIELIAVCKSERTERDQACARLTDLADETLCRLDPELAGGLTYHGLVEVPRRIESLAQVMASWAVTDATVGGDLKPFRRKKHERVNARDDPPPRLARRLASPCFIRNYIRANLTPDTANLAETVERSLKRADRVPPQVLRSRLGTILKLMRQQVALQRQERFAEAEARWSARKKKPTLLIPESDRRLLRRAVSTAETVVGPEATRAFLRGDEVDLPGESVTLVLARRGSLTALGHSQIAVAVKDPATDEQLAQLCVYFEDTPALDQLTAFALHMQAGLEAELIATADITSLTERGAVHPLFAERARRRQEEIAQAHAQLTGPRSFNQDRWNRDTARSERYWLKTAPVWTERLTTYVLGRRGPWLRATIEAGRAA